jgi:hypothetical protein
LPHRARFAPVNRRPLDGQSIDMATKRLKVDLPPNWREASAELDAEIPTFIRSNSKDSGALQVSTAWYKSGPPPMPGAKDLIDFAKHLILRQANVCDIEDGAVGECEVGSFGTVIARIADSRVQVWCASNGYDFVISTHTSIGESDPLEIEEADAIVRGMWIGYEQPPKPWWKLW